MDNYSRGIAAGMYITSSPEACQFVCESCRANIVVVENDQQLRKILKIRKSLPELKAIVQYHGVPREKGVLSVSFTEYINASAVFSDKMLFFSGENYKKLERKRTIRLCLTF